MLLGHARVPSLTRPGEEEREQNEIIGPVQSVQELGHCQKKVEPLVCREGASERWSARVIKTHSRRAGGVCCEWKRLRNAKWTSVGYEVVGSQFLDRIDLPQTRSVA